MKKKLRKIKINNAKYLYAIYINYYSPSKTSRLTLKIFLSGQQQTPLIIDFLTIHDSYTGHPLNVGVILTNSKTNESILVNLHEPKFIREFVLLGLKNGWAGTNKVDIQNGLSYLKELGYEVSSIQPESHSEIPNYNTSYKNTLT